MENKITIKEELDSALADDAQKGDIILAQIKEVSKQCDKVILDFTGIEIVNTAFLNNAIGKLFNIEEYNLNEHPIMISNMDSNMRELLTESVKVARAMYFHM